MLRKIRFLSAGAALFAIFCPIAQADDPFAKFPNSFMSSGKKIKSKLYEPLERDVKRPAVIMLHGSDGWGQMIAYNLCAQDMVKRGMVVLLIHYYSATDTNDTVTAEERDAVVRWLNGQPLEEAKKAAVDACFQKWVQCVGDAAEHVRKLPNVDPDRVGLAGFSLGGFLAVTCAAEPKFKFKALVEMFGGLPTERRDFVKKLPPTLIVHGEKDNVVDVRQARDLDKFAKSRNANVECVYYPECYHALCDAKGNPRMKDINDAIGRMSLFFGKEFGLRESAKSIEVRPK